MTPGSWQKDPDVTTLAFETKNGDKDGMYQDMELFEDAINIDLQKRKNRCHLKTRENV